MIRSVSLFTSFSYVIVLCFHHFIYIYTIGLQFDVNVMELFWLAIPSSLSLIRGLFTIPTLWQDD